MCVQCAVVCAVNRGVGAPAACARRVRSVYAVVRCVRVRCVCVYVCSAVCGKPCVCACSEPCATCVVNGVFPNKATTAVTRVYVQQCKINGKKKGMQMCMSVQLFASRLPILTERCLVVGGVNRGAALGAATGVGMLGWEVGPVLGLTTGPGQH